MKITKIKIVGYEDNNSHQYKQSNFLNASSTPVPTSIKAGNKIMFRFEFDEALPNNKAPKIVYKVYARANKSQGDFMPTSCKGTVEAKGNVITLDKGFPENYAGAELAISFGLGNPYKPPFKDANKNLVHTVKFISLYSSEQGAPKVKSVVWSSKEQIKFGEDSPARTTIDKNEDGFLHIHTRGMYMQKVKVQIYELDRTGSDALLKTYDNITINDNTLYLPIPMDEIFYSAEKERHKWSEGDYFDLFAKVTPVAGGVSAKNSDMLYMSIEETTISSLAKSTIEGVKLVVIKAVDLILGDDNKGCDDGDKEKKEKKCFCDKEHVDIRDKMTFKAQGQGSTNCKDVCDSIIKDLSIKSEGSTVLRSDKKYDAFYQLAKENSSGTALEFSASGVNGGVEYLDLALDNGYPVVVGVNHTFGNTYNEKTTDHFVIIVGRYCEEKTVYYRFWDVGTSKGNTADYKFTLDSQNHLFCEKNYNSKRYDVTQIRRNIKDSNTLTIEELKK